MSAAVAPWVEELRRFEEQLIDACIITGKSEDEILAAAAKSPLSFADFVRQLKTGMKP